VFFYYVDNIGSRQRGAAGLGVGRVLMDSRRAEALSGVMVASTGGLTRLLRRSMP
jgi:tRNA G18 (ribose-2'-O)-methylase SpoU